MNKKIIKTLTVCAALLCATSSSAYEKTKYGIPLDCVKINGKEACTWEGRYIYLGGNKKVQYFFHPAKPKDNEKRGWLMINGAEKGISGVILYRFDCKNKAMEELQSFGFSEPLLRGPVATMTDNSQTGNYTKQAPPGSDFYNILTVLCKILDK